MAGIKRIRVSHLQQGDITTYRAATHVIVFVDVCGAGGCGWTFRQCHCQLGQIGSGRAEGTSKPMDNTTVIM